MNQTGKKAASEYHQIQTLDAWKYHCLFIVSSCQPVSHNGSQWSEKSFCSSEVFVKLREPDNGKAAYAYTQNRKGQTHLFQNQLKIHSLNKKEE